MNCLWLVIFVAKRESLWFPKIFFKLYPSAIYEVLQCFLFSKIIKNPHTHTHTHTVIHIFFFPVYSPSPHFNKDPYLGKNSFPKWYIICHSRFKTTSNSQICLISFNSKNQSGFLFFYSYFHPFFLFILLCVLFRITL